MTERRGVKVGIGRLVARTALCALVMFGVGQRADAQQRSRTDEVRMLREAANRESEGDLDGAERILRDVLAASPGSSGALFALERVLRAQGETAELLPVVDSFLARNPTSSGVRYLKLRVLAETDSLDALRAEAEAWIGAEPTSEAPYREIARVYERAFGPDEALALLRRGRSAAGREGALALEIGDVLASGGETSGAVDEWALAVLDDEAQVVTVIRRVRGLSGGGAEAGRRLVRAVAASADLEARRSAARIALELAIEDEAMELSRHVADRLDGRVRESFLADVARRAREQELGEIASWAYDELGQSAATPVERRQFDQRIVDVALASGDTTTALEAQRRLAASFSSGSVDRRRAMAELIRLEGVSAPPERLRGLLDEFRGAFPSAPELDGLSATVAAALHARGDVEAARAVVAGIEGPHSALERGFLDLGAGALEEGRAALLLAVTGLPPAEATPVIQFAGLFDRVSEDGAALLAEAGVAEHRGAGALAAGDLADGVAELAEDERPLLLAEAARIATRAGADDVAATIHRRIVTDHPGAAEVGEAALALARFYARSPDGVEEAISLLEQLITVRPNAAIVPDARIELERLRAGGR